ncbi:hypothetical protein [Streptomyces sp. SID1121]|uniref:hypothetical protein n=1 Tax=Streptomyces sp. SID1121 TaxID=3425888 RepID=UPI00405682AC
MMDSAVAGLLAAVVGVGGALGSAWLTQRRGEASRRAEQEHLERTRLAELASQRRQSDLASRKAAYTEFNAAARHYLATLNDHTHVLRPGSADSRESLHAVDTARAEYRRRYAEAQMLAPDAVLAEVRRVNAGLGAVYGALARLTRGTAREGEDVAAARAGIATCWADLSRMRATMRADLDVTGPSPA